MPCYYIIGDLVPFELELNVGWNLISLPVAPLEPAVETVFDDANFTATDGSRGTIYADSVWAWDVADGQYEAVTTMTPKSWGYLAEAVGQHKGVDEVWETIAKAYQSGCNLLLNTGPLPDGSIDADDDAVLREVGKRIATKGFPV